MKKLIGLLLLSMLFFVPKSHAQVSVMKNPNGVAIDTVTNTTSEGPKAYTPGTQKTVSIVLSTTKISGTIAGSVNWQGSHDGVIWNTISTTALVDASTVYGYKETDKAWLYYRALIAPTGTSSVSYSGTIYVTTAR